MLIIRDQSEKRPRFTRETLVSLLRPANNPPLAFSSLRPFSFPHTLLVLFILAATPFPLPAQASSCCSFTAWTRKDRSNRSGPLRSYRCPRAYREWAAAGSLLSLSCLSRLFLAKNRAIDQGNCESASRSLGNNPVSTRNVARRSRDSFKTVSHEGSLQKFLRIMRYARKRCHQLLHSNVTIAPIVEYNSFRPRALNDLELCVSQMLSDISLFFCSHIAMWASLHWKIFFSLVVINVRKILRYDDKLFLEWKFRIIYFNGFYQAKSHDSLFRVYLQCKIKLSDYFTIFHPAISALVNRKKKKKRKGIRALNAS